jgi:hypothetical protein
MLYEYDHDFQDNKQNVVTQKTKSSANRYKVRITETLEMKVYVYAASREAAYDITQNRYRNEEYVLGPENFTDVTISVLYG